MARLVRCPKCQKLLVEYPNVPVYQCGGCGIVLRAKNHGDSPEEKSIAEPSQMNQPPESQSDVGFSDSEWFSSPSASIPKLENKPEENSSPASNQRRSSRAEVDDLEEEAVDQVENEAAVALAVAEEQIHPHVAARSVGSEEEEEDMAERSRHEGIRYAYYDGSISSSDEAQSVQSAERKFGKSRRTIKAASNSDLKLRSGSVRSASSLPATTTRFHAARDRASSSTGSFFDADEFQITEENRRALPEGSSSGELRDRAALLRKIDEVRGQLVKISVAASEGRAAPATNSWSSGSRRQPDPIRKSPTHHCRAVSGAAPFVICGNCTKLLQLPPDFLSTRRRRRRRLYKLRCAGCSAVLDLPFPAKDRRFPTEADEELDSGGGGGRGGAARGNLTPRRLHRLMGYDSASDLLLAGEEVHEEGRERMESAGRRSYHGNVRAGIPRPPVMK